MHFLEAANWRCILFRKQAVDGYQNILDAPHSISVTIQEADTCSVRDGCSGLSAY